MITYWIGDPLLSPKDSSEAGLNVSFDEGRGGCSSRDSVSSVILRKKATGKKK